jgi:hypothetical protein
MSFGDWINGNFYEVSDEKFGICPFPGLFIYFTIDIG